MVPSRSKKLAKPRFLKGDRCSGVQFFNSKTQTWEFPKDKDSQTLPLHLTDYSCPVCGSPLAKHEYVKEGKTKTRLTCSQESSDKKRHKDVVYFEAKGGFWSPKFGELSSLANLSKKD
ncbi:MAG: hypothetical protein ACRDEA_02410 [Microcystaceae cyanobacterium]